MSEVEKFYEILKQRKEAGNPVAQDVATHTMILINNGWPAQDALEESQRTLDEAEQEGQY